MNLKHFKHPDSPLIRQTRNPLTARALKAAGWKEVTLVVTVKAGEAKK